MCCYVNLILTAELQCNDPISVHLSVMIFFQVSVMEMDWALILSLGHFELYATGRIPLKMLAIALAIGKNSVRVARQPPSLQNGKRLGLI